jgi:hypothetical protein
MRRRPSVERNPSVRSASPGVLRVGLAIALGLHALGLAALTWLHHERSPVSLLAPATPAPAAEPLIWVERTEEPQLAREPEVEGAPSVVQAQPEVEGAPGVVQAPPEVEGAPRVEAPPERAETQPIGSRRVARAVTPRRAAAPEPEAAAAAHSEEDADEDISGNDEAQAAAPQTPPAAPADRPLSLAELGVGSDNNPFLAPAPAQRSLQQPSTQPSLQQPSTHASGQRFSGRQPTARELGARIDHLLRSALAEHDRELGLGPEGPAVAAVLDLVMQSNTSPNTDALLVLRTDGDGQTLQVDVAEASRDTDAWNAIAQSLLKALQGKKLRVPHGSGGVTMQLRVGSRETLPSGADPGLAVDLFGQEVKAGAGPKSTRLQLLTPKITLEEYQVSPTDPHLRIPVIGFQLTILAILGDPVDLGAVARRVVHAHLVSLETHPPQPKQ